MKTVKALLVYFGVYAIGFLPFSNYLLKGPGTAHFTGLGTVAFLSVHVSILLACHHYLYRVLHKLHNWARPGNVRVVLAARLVGTVAIFLVLPTVFVVLSHLMPSQVSGSLLPHALELFAWLGLLYCFAEFCGERLGLIEDSFARPQAGQ